jgi:hypothetical protein
VARWGSALLTVCLLTGVAAGCSDGVEPDSAQTPAHPASSVSRATSPKPTATAGPSTVRGTPLPARTMHRMPAGAFYLLAGRNLASLNVWQVVPGGREQQVTGSRRGLGIDAFAASRAGLILADDAHGADSLARWTGHGSSWLREPGRRGALVRGSSPDISNGGMIGYVTPPKAYGHGRSAEFAIWIQPSFASRATLVHRQRQPLDGPVFGPDGQIAVEGWQGPAGRREPSVIIYQDGALRKLRTGVPAIPSLLAWGQHAPALAVAFPSHAAELLYPDGRRVPLPPGWQPLAWNPAGTRLLMQSATALGIWSVRAPGRVVRLGPITPGVQILEATWLARKVPM